MRNEELWYRLAAIDFLFCRGVVARIRPELSALFRIGDLWSPACHRRSVFGKNIISDKFNMCVNIEFT